ncbi:triple tyrosine motif-containing protein [Robiginitalea sp. M366]|uniref:helix-turn-helix and ligand-binding sensor domain-containing protein n=1 Tax=Robiginitalea aestuariiviva TaxID=3036903 RepID=UPI00240DDBCA|nr:triple tyrosine motif-containing protein [Robiginitalea aestuariiviva]MDG1572243.1 triple tyrosine motif-containing protein [Robiginitalea aestuariiviva]
MERPFQDRIKPMHRTHRILLFFFWLGMLLSSPAQYGQTLPPIRNFEPAAYGADNQNWGVAQTDRGWMYLANNGGLLEFNGVDWRRYPSPNGSEMRAVFASGNRVYSGCYMEFGYWEPDGLGGLIYTSLSRELEAPLLQDEQFWRIRALGGWVLFQSLQRIYAYRPESGRLTVIPSEASRAQLFEFDGALYFRKEAEGLLRMENGQARVLLPRSDIGTQVFVGMVRVGQEPALIGENGEFLVLEASGVRRWVPPGLQGQPGVTLYSASQLADGSLALGTISEGVMLLRPDGSLLEKIGKAEGLNNNTVLSVFEDRDQNLWLALDNGISVVNRGAAFSEYVDRAGTLGVVYAAREHQGRRYLGTNQGLFQAPLESDGPYTLVPGTEGQVWCIREYDGVLLCGHNQGTFQVDGTRARLVGDAPGTWDIKPVPGQNNLLLQGGYQGLSVLERGPEGWALRNTLEGFGISSRFFEFTADEKLLVNHEYKGVYTLQTDPDYQRVTDSLHTPAFGFGASLFRFRNAVYYANSSGVFQYEPGQGFVADSTLNALLYSGEDDPVGLLLPDEQSDRLWGLGNRTLYNVKPDPLGAELRLQTIHVPEGFRRSLGVVGFECIAPLSPSRYLFGRSDGYLLLDLDKLEEKRPAVYLRQVQQQFYNRDSTVTLPLDNPETALPYRLNNLQFTFGVPLYDKYREVEYQYWLEGYQEAWSNWSTQAAVRFDNLPYGTYTFHVRARVGDARSENTVRYPFEIARPWYFTYWALALFALALAGMAYLVHHRYRSHYRRQQALLQLKAQRKLRQKKRKTRRKMMEMRNAHLQREIESKNRELAVSTMSLIKKNEFLNALKEQLRKAETPGQVKSVIRTIDRNINNQEDWEFFETAFNNADQDFLHTVKKRHPDLTPNDLKLCAYLRLNLSSKEIAPLLNISVRSVEVKRYRLRKKMNLEHDQSLTNYILEL